MCDPGLGRAWLPRLGSTVAELRAAYGRRVSTSFGTPGPIHRLRVRFGGDSELSGFLSDGTASATITGLARRTGPDAT
jgi:hypothetical protein